MADDKKECTHEDMKSKASFDKKLKIINQIYNKLTIYIKATMEEITHNNAGFILQVIMRELNKQSGLYGFDKKDMAIFIMVLLLESLGCPEVIAYYVPMVIAEMIETIYINRMHKFKKTSKCFIM